MLRDILDFSFFFLAFLVPMFILSVLLTLIHTSVLKAKNNDEGRNDHGGHQ